MRAAASGAGCKPARALRLASKLLAAIALASLLACSPARESSTPADAAQTGAETSQTSSIDSARSETAPTPETQPTRQDGEATTPPRDRHQADRANEPGAVGKTGIGEVDYSCSTDADCSIKDIGSCCGYYPACVNIDSPTFPDEVKADCQAKGMSGVCGFPSLAGCQCIEGRCEGIPGPTRNSIRID